MATVEFKLIKNFLSKDELKMLQKYCYNRLDFDNYKGDKQTDSPSYYYDPLMMGLLDIKLPLVEKESGLKLFPTFSYWRYYVFGGKLAKHIDRPSCEVSVTACIKKYDNWPILIEGHSYELEEGEALLYAGCIQDHWRPGIYKGEGMAQMFVHYVDQNGPFTHHAYDKFLKSVNYENGAKTEDGEIIKKERLRWKQKNS